MLSDLLLPSSTFKDSCDYVGSTWIIQDDISISTWPAKPFRSYKVTCSWVPEVILLTSLGAMGGRWQWDRNRLGRLDAGPHSQLEPGHPHSHQAYLLRFKLKLGKFGNYFQRYKIMESLCSIAPSASSHSSWKWPKGGLASCSICMGLGEQTVALEGKRWAVQLSRVMNTWPSLPERYALMSFELPSDPAALLSTCCPQWFPMKCIISPLLERRCVETITDDHISFSL